MRPLYFTVPVRRRAGFTLVELLVVVAILIVLAALVFSISRRALAAAKEQRNMNQLRNLGGVVFTYAGEFGHFPPGWDPSYTQSGYGPRKMEWQASRDRYPDILNAYMDSPAPIDLFLSPSAETRLDPDQPTYQPINYCGHPGLIWHRGDKGALSSIGTPPFGLVKVKRPSEVFLFTDGVSKEGDTLAKNCQTSVRNWGQDGSVVMADPRRGNRALDLKPQSVGGGDFNGIEFRNRGKTHTLFCDGSVRLMAPEDWKVSNVALGY